MTPRPQTAPPWPAGRPSAATRARSWSGLLALLAAACSPSGDPPAEGGAAADKPAHAQAALEADAHAWDYPSLACRANGDTWLACILWQDGADWLELRSVARDDTRRVQAWKSPTRMLGTAAAVDETDAMHVVWSEQVSDGWDLRELVFAPSTHDGDPGAHGEPTTLFHAAGCHALWPVLAEDARHTLLLACVQLDGEGPAIFALAHPAGGAWGAPLQVSGARGSNWSPAVACLAENRFAVAWDSATDGDFDVLLAQVDVAPDGALRAGPRQRVTDTPRRESHPSLACDGKRLLVAYDVGPEHWGREGSVNKLEESLHTGRQIEIVAIEDGRVAPLAVQPLVEMNDLLARNCELPKIAFESTGCLVMLYRGLPLPLEYDDPEDPSFQDRAEKKAGGVGWRTSIWFTYLTRFDGSAWHLGDKHHLGVPGSEGRSDAPLTVSVRPGGGIAYAVVGDRREVPQLVAEGEKVSPEEMRARVAESKNWWRPVTKNATTITTGMIKKTELASPLQLGPSRPLAAERAPSAAAPLPQRTLVDGTRLQLALGDLHRHTDISRCSSNWDGPFEDALRYAWDAAPLQFLAVTDHFEHMTAYDWWRNLSWADAYDTPGRLVSLRAYERAEPRTGHRNVISRGAGPPLVAYRNVYDKDRDAGRADSEKELWPQLDPADVITIPHTPAGMFPTNPNVFDWSGLDPRFDRLVEVFQSYRGSSEAVGAPRAIPNLVPARYVLPNLDLGMQFGLIASSDHQTSDGAFAGAWVTDLTRDGVFAALHGRLTFASTVRGALWTEWNGVPMGTSARAPAGVDSGFVVDVDGFGRELSKLELITDGAVTQTRPVHGSTAHETFTLQVPSSGSRYAYVRVTFSDGELMWSSPVRLSRDGAEGPDGLSGPQVLQQRGDVWGPRVMAPAGTSPDGAPAGAPPAGPH